MKIELRKLKTERFKHNGELIEIKEINLRQEMKFDSLLADITKAGEGAVQIMFILIKNNAHTVTKNDKGEDVYSPIEFDEEALKDNSSPKVLDEIRPITDRVLKLSGRAKTL